ncbi:MAG TPA: SDR family NAD(P)-dependent oxidoreductase, partial [Candidatus Dormibacteraeota bacterium]
MRTIVVTGGGTGIGRAIADAFAADGEKVVIIGRRAALLERAAAETGAAWLTCDVSDPGAVMDFTNWLLREIGPTVDVIVNNAGGTG